MNNKSTKKLVVRYIVISLLILALIFVIYKYTPHIMKLVSSPADVKNLERFRTRIRAYGPSGAFVFVMLMALQIIIAVIPGEFIQIAGGYIFGIMVGTILEIIGIVLGTAIVFFMTRFLSSALIYALMPKEKLERFNNLINSHKSEIIMFVLFLIPGIPKDPLVYAAGFTPIQPLKFIIISLIARLPGILGSVIIGANIHSRHYGTVIALSVIFTAILVIGLIFKDRVINFLHKYIGRKN